MKSFFHNRNYRTLLNVIPFLAFIVILNTHVPHSVVAQDELEPQLVTATLYNSDCYPNGVENYIEIFNVGAQGGEAYSQAVYTYAITHIGNHPDGGIACFVDGYAKLNGTFTGGPNGTITFPEGNEPSITTCQVINGNTIECTFVMDLLDLGVDEFTSEYTILNPEAFEKKIQPVPEPTATPGGDCIPTVRGIDPQKPGDIISPGADYVDENGAATGIIQERWFFNGKESTSIVWDGNPVSVELQYTCLNHAGYSKTYSIAAYQEPSAPTGGEPDSNKPGEVPSSSENPENQNDPKMLTPLGVAVLIGGVVGGLAVLGGVGIGVGLLLKPKPPVPGTTSPASPPPTAASPNYVPPRPQVPNTPPRSPVPNTPSRPPIQSTPPAQVRPLEPPPPNQPQGLTNAQRVELVNIRQEMQNEIDHVKTKWRANRDAVEKLKEMLKKNLLKFTFKKGFEVSEWVMNSPVEVINKVAVDPLMEKAFEKHDTSQDSNIILQINNRIQQLQNEMKDQINQVNYLQKEISKINEKLG